jgi:hypothetical protein
VKLAELGGRLTALEYSHITISQVAGLILKVPFKKELIYMHFVG